MINLFLRSDRNAGVYIIEALGSNGVRLAARFVDAVTAGDALPLALSSFEFA